MKRWRKIYEAKHSVQFYKYILADGEHDAKKKYSVTLPPIVVFFRNGVEIERIANFEESDPYVSNTTKPDEESNDEKRIKERLNHWCEKK
jgi:hypothetical protein